MTTTEITKLLSYVRSDEGIEKTRRVFKDRSMPQIIARVIEGNPSSEVVDEFIELVRTRGLAAREADKEAFTASLAVLEHAEIELPTEGENHNGTF